MKRFSYNCDFTEELNQIESYCNRDEAEESILGLIEEFVWEVEKLIGEDNVEILESTYFTSIFINLENDDVELEWKLDQMYDDLYANCMNIIKEVLEKEEDEFGEY